MMEEQHRPSDLVWGCRYAGTEGSLEYPSSSQALPLKNFTVKVIFYTQHMHYPTVPAWDDFNLSVHFIWNWIIKNGTCLFY